MSDDPEVARLASSASGSNAVSKMTGSTHKHEEQPLVLPHKSKPGLVRIWRALHYSLAGLRSAFVHESAFRQELALAAVLIPVAFLLSGTVVQQALLLLSVLVVLITELLNSAVEAVVDRVSTDDHELAQRAKDMGSAAVFVSLTSCALVWGLVLFDIFA